MKDEKKNQAEYGMSEIILMIKSIYLINLSLKLFYVRHNIFKWVLYSKKLRSSYFMSSLINFPLCGNASSMKQWWYVYIHEILINNWRVRYLWKNNMNPFQKWLGLLYEITWIRVNINKVFLDNQYTFVPFIR